MVHRRRRDGVVRPEPVHAAVMRTVECERAKHSEIQRVPDVNEVCVGELKRAVEHIPQLRHAVQEQQKNRTLHTQQTGCED